MKYTSSLKLTSAIAVGKDYQRKAKQIVQSLIDNPESGQFRQPVNWQALNILDYLSVIKQPMDLSTVSLKINTQQYQYVEEILDDLQMIWDNCKLYNPRGSWIHVLADKLEKVFKKMVKNYFPAVQYQNQVNAVKPVDQRNSHQKNPNSSKVVQKNVQQKTPVNRNNTSRVSSDPVLLENFLKETQEQAKKQEGIRTQSKKVQNLERLYYQDEEQISYEEKIKFADKLKRFDQRSLKNIVDFICIVCPTAFSEIDNEANIIVDNMDVITFRQVIEKVDEEIQQMFGENNIQSMI